MGPHDSRYFKEGLDLLNRTQGLNLFDEKYLVEKTADASALVVGAYEYGNLLGIGVAQVISDFRYYLPFDSKIVEDLASKKVGSFSTLSVQESHQGTGIGSAISKFRMNWLRDQNCEVVIGVSWVSGNTHTSNHTFEKSGFRKVKRVEDFFHDSSLKDPFICPTCGVPPCRCPAILYRIDL